MITQKACRQTFSRLGWVMILSQLLMLAVVWIGEEVYRMWLVYRYPSMLQEEILLLLKQNGVTLILSAIAGVIPCVALGVTTNIKELPQYFLRQRKMISGSGVICSLLLVLGLQNIASILTIPFESLANWFGGSFFYAYESAMAVTTTHSMLLYSVLIAPFCEELLYRGFVLQYLRSYGKTFAIVFAAMLFGLMHGNVIQLPKAILCGILFGYLAAEYSLFVSIAIHILTNLTAVFVNELGAADEVFGEGINQALFAFGLITLFLFLSRCWTQIKQYARDGCAQKGTIKQLLTCPPILLLIFYLIALTAISIQPL